ncbi:hypothetical protein OQH60_01095 [Campylobacter sp. MIT 21-1685]|uniref:hypothetical protein n=1 Tax=unclassified Campylobacter TaxID=2593542 RepID=UPI00224B367A|nr:MULTISPECIES: hypothetical protein [unclassified Campylobacter]MCX2682474.1 hypothetical protein [Campylobacter sp. MIT 21-1684]MCX2750813.1 hypothetical protein [Campylobacter sp. MIT 21-1682]MCX2806955.1 hypothetical protein [Campylobacter sp. MIT 21-1685]
MQINTYSKISSIDQSVNKKTDKNTKETNIQSANTSLEEKTLEKLNSLGAKGLTQLYFIEFQQQTLNTTFGNTSAQSDINELLKSKNLTSTLLSKIDFTALGYNGKNPLDMNKDELAELLSEKGFFGVENTANRIADFIIKGAGDDVEKLKKGFEGMKRGFEQAEKMWGKTLPQISQDTMSSTLEKVSNRINELGAKTLDVQA